MHLLKPLFFDEYRVFSLPRIGIIFSSIGDQLCLLQDLINGANSSATMIPAYSTILLEHPFMR